METKLPERERLWAAAPARRGGPLISWGWGSPLLQAHTARSGLLETPPRDELMLDARVLWARLFSAKSTPKTGEGKYGQADTLKPTRKLKSELLVAVFSVWGDKHTAAQVGFHM